MSQHNTVAVNDVGSGSSSSSYTTETIDYGKAKACATQLISLSGQMSEILHNKVEEYLKEIGPGSSIYSGSSASVVRNRFLQFSNTFESFIKAVNEEGEFVKKAVEAYTNVDSVI